MDCSMPSFTVLHYLLEFVQIHVHWVSDAIQPSHPLLCLQSFPASGSFPVSWLLVSGGQSIGASAYSSQSPCSYPAMIHTYLGTPAPLLPLGPISSLAYSRKPSLLPVPLWNIPDASTLGSMPGPCSVSQAGRKASHLSLPTLREPSPTLVMPLTMGAAPPGDLQEGSKWHP